MVLVSIIQNKKYFNKIYLALSIRLEYNIPHFSYRKSDLLYSIYFIFEIFYIQI